MPAPKSTGKLAAAATDGKLAAAKDANNKHAKGSIHKEKTPEEVQKKRNDRVLKKKEKAKRKKAQELLEKEIPEKDRLDAVVWGQKVAAKAAQLDDEDAPISEGDEEDDDEYDEDDDGMVSIDGSGHSTPRVVSVPGAPPPVSLSQVAVPVPTQMNTNEHK